MRGVVTPRYVVRRISACIEDATRSGRRPSGRAYFSSNRAHRPQQFACAIGQRGWKRQPLGGLAGLGTSPSRMIRFRARVGSGTGIAEISAFV